jgi:long-chain fatty acid transport protein
MNSIIMIFHFYKPCSDMKPYFNKLQFLISCISLGISSQATAGAFSLYTEGSASAIGNFAAGVAAEGRDASIGWFNPAGLVLIRQKELVAGAVGVLPNASLTGEAKFYQSDLADAYLPPYVQSFQNLNGARSAVVPNLHIAIPVGDRVTYGLSIVSPLGLSTNWPKDSALRYAGTLSELRMIDISPEMGGLLTDNFALGWGLDIQYADVSFNNMLGAPAALQYVGSDPTSLDSELINHGTSAGLGFHAGLLLMSNDKNSRFGFNYQYGVRHDFNGYSSLTGKLVDNFNGFIDPNVTYKVLNLSTNPIQFPNIFTFSVYHQVAPRVAMMGSVVYSTWSSFKTISLKNVAAYSAREDALYQASAQSLQNYQNTIRAAFGMNFDVNDRWQLRWGGGYDQSPTNDLDRDVRLPDVDKLAIAIGLRWTPSQHVFCDIGYSYLMPLNNVKINKLQDLDADNYITVNATGHAYAQLIGAQIAWRG